MSPFICWVLLALDEQQKDDSESVESVLNGGVRMLRCIISATNALKAKMVFIF